MNLEFLFDKYDCDKGNERHKYYLEYEEYFKEFRDKPINFLEVGVYKGASTRAFHEYFPNANIYAIDVFERTDPEEVDILSDERVRWLKCDSMDPSLGGKIRKEWGDVKFDFIIDDGAHWPEANRRTFENLMPFLNDDGTYFIEDLWPMHIMTEEECQHSWFSAYPDLYVMEEHEKLMRLLAGYKTKHYDRRTVHSSGDTYIIAIEK